MHLSNINFDCAASEMIYFRRCPFPPSRGSFLSLTCKCSFPHAQNCCDRFPVEWMRNECTKTISDLSNPMSGHYFCRCDHFYLLSGKQITSSQRRSNEINIPLRQLRIDITKSGFNLDKNNALISFQRTRARPLHWPSNNVG